MLHKNISLYTKILTKTKNPETHLSAHFGMTFSPICTHWLLILLRTHSKLSFIAFLSISGVGALVGAAVGAPVGAAVGLPVAGVGTILPIVKLPSAHSVVHASAHDADATSSSLSQTARQPATHEDTVAAAVGTPLLFL